MIIRDREGRFLCDVKGVNFLDCRDLRRADFSGQTLEGIYLDDSDLREADFSGADMYCAMAFRAKFDNATLRDAKLAGASLREASFRSADLTGAYLSLNNLGGSPTLEGADLTDALLNRTILTGCHYNDSTRFPEGFDPKENGMIWVNPERIYIRPGSFASANMEPGYYIPDKDNPGRYIPDKNK